jgi:AraC-like DNA-binding protein
MYVGGGITLARFDHPCQEVHVDPVEEVAKSTSLNFVESGSFGLQSGKNRWVLGESSCFVTRPDMVYRSRHHEDFPTDVCLSLLYEEETVDEVCSVAGRLDGRPVIAVSNRSRYLVSRLTRSIQAQIDGIEIELLARQILAEAIDPNLKHRYSRAQVNWYAERIDAVRSRIDRDLASRFTLHALARAAGMSPFHFARVFSELVGMPPHRYVLTARLRAAAKLLLDGGSVTAACFEVGFNQLPHFSRMFQREFGYSPSRFKDSIRPSKSRRSG